jgi:hypothetical protein
LHRAFFVVDFVEAFFDLFSEIRNVGEGLLQTSPELSFGCLSFNQRKVIDAKLLLSGIDLGFYEGDLGLVLHLVKSQPCRLQAVSRHPFHLVSESLLFGRTRFAGSGRHYFRIVLTAFLNFLV